MQIRWWHWLHSAGSAHQTEWTGTRTMSFHRLIKETSQFQPEQPINGTLFLEHFLGISKNHPTRSHRDFYYSFFFFPRSHLRGFIKYCMWRNSERALREALIFKPELILTEILHYRASYYRSSRRESALHFQNKAQGVRVSLQMRRKTSAAALPLLYMPDMN